MRLTEYDPIRVLPPTVMRDLPFRIDNRRLSYLDNTVASGKSSLLTRSYQVNMCPLIAMIVNVVGNFAEQDPFFDQDPPCFSHENRKGMGKRVPVLF